MDNKRARIQRDDEDPEELDDIDLSREDNSESSDNDSSMEDDSDEDSDFEAYIRRLARSIASDNNPRMDRFCQCHEGCRAPSSFSVRQSRYMSRMLRLQDQQLESLTRQLSQCQDERRRMMERHRVEMEAMVQTLNSIKEVVSKAKARVLPKPDKDPDSYSEN